jgi:hypothetical protein
MEPLQNETGNSTAVLSEAQPTDTGQNPVSERSFESMRSSPRKKFVCNQRIAPMHTDIMPQPDDYINVECNDISQGGMSFYLKRPPGCDRFAVKLGQKQVFTVIIARVVNQKEVQHNGEKMHLVGCQFVNRTKD